MKMSLFQSKRFVLTLTLTMCCVAFSVFILGLAIAFNKAPNRKSTSVQYIYGNNSITKLEVIDNITLEDDTIEKLQPKIQVTATGEQGQFGELVLVTQTHVVFDYILAGETHSFATMGKGITVNVGSSMVGRASSMTIPNITKLQAFRKQVNDGSNDYSGTTVKLTADIDLGNEEWEPIGTMANPFKGVFSGENATTGKNFTISGLKISETSLLPVGLFGCATNATIKNVNITKSTITNSALYAGLLLGMGGQTNIENCNVDSSCSINLQSGMIIGGVCGVVEGGSIKKCNSDPKITITKGDIVSVGGIAGAVTSMTIEDCCSKAEIAYSESVEADYSVNLCVGGMVGQAEGQINKCLFNGSIKVQSKSSVRRLQVAGIVGDIGEITIKNCVVNLSNISITNNNLEKKNINKFDAGKNANNDDPDDLYEGTYPKGGQYYYYESNTGGTEAMVYPIHAGCYYTTKRKWYVNVVVVTIDKEEDGIGVAMKNGKYWTLIDTHNITGHQADMYTCDEYITLNNDISNNYYTGSSSSLSSDWKQYATRLSN